MLTLGNQDLWANYDQLKSFFEELDCPFEEPKVTPRSSYLVECLSDDAGSYKLKQLADAHSYVHARTFFEMMGIKDYYDIDKFDYEKPQILHDLNTPISAELYDKFNLIIDSGTIEHIFDVRQVMENIARMCKEGGWVVHITPSSNFVDHGFFSFSPCFFYDFYRVNGFDDFTCYVLQLNVNNYLDPCYYIEYHYGMNLHGLIQPNKEILVFFAARKTAKVESVVIPTQGIYAPEQRDAQEKRGEEVAPSFSLFNRFVPAFIQPVFKPLRPWLWHLRRRVLPEYLFVRKKI